MRSQLGTEVEDTAREIISEKMVAMLGHHPATYVTTAVPIATIAEAITWLQTGFVQIFFSTVGRSSVTPNGPWNKLNHRTSRGDA
jgi:hypothetical protein